MGEFGAGALPSFDLVEREGQIDIVLVCVQRRVADIVVSVGGDELSCRLVEIHAVIIRGGMVPAVGKRDVDCPPNVDKWTTWWISCG